MHLRILQQPDGLYAIFSNLEARLLTVDATREEIVDNYADWSMHYARMEAEATLQQLAAGIRPFLTWDKAIESHRFNQGRASAEFNACVEEAARRQIA